jgi:hypothetical protein
MSRVGTCHEQTILCIEETKKNFILAICSWDKSQYVLNKLPCSDAAVNNMFKSGGNMRRSIPLSRM